MEMLLKKTGMIETKYYHIIDYNHTNA